MSAYTREDLEKQALHEVCTCWYYDLADGIDAVDDETLHKIIEMPMYSHLQAQIEQPVPLDEFMEEINNCYELNYSDTPKTKYELPNFSEEELAQSLSKLTIRKVQ